MPNISSIFVMESHLWPQVFQPANDDECWWLVGWHSNSVVEQEGVVSAIIFFSIVGSMLIGNCQDYLREQIQERLKAVRAILIGEKRKKFCSNYLEQMENLKYFNSRDLFITSPQRRRYLSKLVKPAMNDGRLIIGLGYICFRVA